MCGIVAYFGGAGNHLTRILTGMSAIIYRAPDSTGIGLFGDDREPVRLRKSLGSVVHLFGTLQAEAAYSRPEAIFQHVLTPDVKPLELEGRQQSLLDFEGFDPPSDRTPLSVPDFDALVNLETENPARLIPGCAGKALFQEAYHIRSRKGLSAVIRSLVSTFDLSPLVIHTLIRTALAATIDERRKAGAINASDADILTTFDDMFEATRAGARVKQLRRRMPHHIPKPSNARKELWQCLIKTVIHIPADFDRDGVCCLFRLLDAVLLSRMAGEPNLGEELDRVLDIMWLPSQRPHRIDWRNLYAAEKSLNVYGWAGAAALAYLQREFFFPAVNADMERTQLMTSEAVVPGQTDPLLLRYLVTPIIAHGRWAMQSAVTVENAHPFMDARRQRALALNGQFDSREEARLRAFLETVGGYHLRSDNSAEYATLLWGHFYDQLNAEQRRSRLVQQQVEKDMADIAICSQSIDFSVYHRVRDCSAADLDQMAFVAATRQIIQNGGQIAVIGISLVSPRRLYVASHNRPVFIVRRLENDDFMVVSDVNAAIGLFPQALVEETINALDTLKNRKAAALSQMAAEGADPALLRSSKSAFGKDRERLLAPFTVEVFPLDGEEIFALIETVLEEGSIRRTVSISDFDGGPLPDVEPLQTRLDPITVRKDVDMSFHETHLREIPERFRYILDIYSPGDTNGGPAIELNTRVLRRRFGRRLRGLRRLILVGTGSSFHMATMARDTLANLMPGVAVDTMRPGDIEDAKRRFLPQQDLVIMLSWSSTTAEMVQLAQRLLKDDTLMVGITEKCFADMALATGKSAGVMPIFSGEEVTIAGIKSTLCMLLCLHLLGFWICSQKELSENDDPLFSRLNNLADKMENLNNDEAVIAFSRKIAASMVDADALVSISATEASGIGQEIALKLEEASWCMVGKWYSYDDILATDPSRWSTNRFVIVHATRRANIEAALLVLQKLDDAGIRFAVVTCRNRHEDRINRLCQNRSLILPCTDDCSQPFFDMAFYYRLALDVGIACGHGSGVAPRNRTKSSTVTRSRPIKRLSSAAELKWMEINTPASAVTKQAPGASDAFRWDDTLDDLESAMVLKELRWLANQLGQQDPLTALGASTEAGAGELGQLLFDPRSEINDVIILPLDAAAQGVARDAAAIWRRLINLPIRELPAGQWPHHGAEESLVLMVATSTGENRHGREALATTNGQKIFWLGPEPPPWLGPSRTTAGRVSMPSADAHCSPARLYAGLNLLLAKAWSHQAPQKAAIVQRHIAGAADAITTLLGNTRTLNALQEIAAANACYRTAFFISPLASAGRVWEEQCDITGRLMAVHHRPGQTGHGPIVTIDGNAESKYVALADRTGMVARYGTTAVARWEDTYLRGESMDDFLAQPPAIPPSRTKAPFYTNNGWYLPIIEPDYETRNDNLIILDMTGERTLPLMLDELSLLGSRAPRLVVITQAERIREIGEKTLFGFPISDLLVLPSPHGTPIADLHLPFVLSAVGAALAAVWQTPPRG